jgi:para-aminobenzoate synthetase component 1
VLGAVCPGGSVTGAPKIRAMQIINALEPVGRSVYCGCIGYIDDGGTMDTNIAIRTLVVTPDAVHCWGGGGIVADSRVELELAEIDHKIGMLLQTAAGLSSSSACRPA